MPSPFDWLARPFPEPLARLVPLALDLHWTWNHAGDAVWRQLDESLWGRTQNAWLVLQSVPSERLEHLAGDAGFLRDVRAFEDSHERYCATPSWRPAGATSLPRVAYFSMEFGLHDALPLYAGGLGILAGDCLKTASDLDVPVIGIGILWQQGYLRQVIDARGWQSELYPYNEPASLPVQPVVTADGERLRIPLTFPGRTIVLRAWQVRVGRTRLYLLDSNDPFNAPADRGLTSTLYGGASEVRLLQAVILGVGGWRLVQALGLDVEVCHLNEGHAAFLVVERARAYRERHRTTFGEALWATRAGNVFTTHTAVAAGFDLYPSEEIEHYRPYFEEYVEGLGLSWDEWLGYGRQDRSDPGAPFNMACLALRGCSWVNGVSQLHGQVSRRLFAGVFPRRPVAEVPVSHITNGVHVPSWDSPWTDDLWTRAAGKGRWRGDVTALTDAMLGLSDEELWAVIERERDDLVRYARERLLRKLSRHGRLDVAARTARDVLRPERLTLGFARRFASYKRPNLLLADPERLLRLLTDRLRPVQIIVAGKAHPNDAEGKALIQRWAQFAARPEARLHVVLLDDYDMRLAAELVQGVDLWINTPRRPWEACGTSGMKVLVNGGLNLSTLDGWWAEAFDDECGWAIGDARDDDADDDERDARQLYALLEDEIVPAFYDRDAEGLPRRWIGRVRASMACLAPRFSSARMLQEYVEKIYVPAASLLRRRSDRAAGVAAQLEHWSRHLSRHWAGIRFGEPFADAEPGRLTVSVAVHLGQIEPGSVRVELYADPRGPEEPFAVPMAAVEPIPGEPNAAIYRLTVDTGRPASDFTPRVVPQHPDACVPLELPLIAWLR